MFRFFLRFCSRYAVLSKFGFSDGKVFWLATLEHSRVSCNFWDQDAISEIIKPCKILLTDVYAQEKSKSVPLLYTSQIKSNDDKVHYSSLDAAKEAVKLQSIQSTKLYLSNDIGFIYRPFSLENPRNHCYLNATLQVILKIVSVYKEPIHVNSNQKGFIFQMILEFFDKQFNDADFSEIKILLV